MEAKRNIAPVETVVSWNNNNLLHMSLVGRQNDAPLSICKLLLCSQKAKNLTGILITDDSFIATPLRLLSSARTFELE